MCLSFICFLKDGWELLPGVCMDCMGVLESDAENSSVWNWDMGVAPNGLGRGR